MPLLLLNDGDSACVLGVDVGDVCFKIDLVVVIVVVIVSITIIKI